MGIDLHTKKRKRIVRKQSVIATYSNVVEKVKIDEQIIIEIGQFADQNNVEIYIVGGYVRDYFMNKSRNDFDFTVVGDAIDFAKKLAKKYKSKALTYNEFGTAMVPIGDYKFEFVGTRKEEYNKDSRKPIVTIGTLEDDLKRRDFTINAMALSLNSSRFGELIDLFGGKRDINSKILRTPLDPFTTFNDDPLRMLRAIRFCTTLNFNIDGASLKAIEEMAQRIKIVSQERITDEFFKILASKKPSIGLKLLHQTGLLKYIFPDLNDLSGIDTVKQDEKTWVHKDVLYHSFQVVDNISKFTDNIWLRFAALIHDIAKPITKKYIEGIGWTFHGHEELGARRVSKIFKFLKLPMLHKDYVEKLVRLHQRPMALVEEGVTDSAFRRLAVNAGEHLEDLFILCKADVTTKNIDKKKEYLKNYNKTFKKILEIQEKDKLREFQSPVRGEEIMQICNLMPSRAVGIIKELIEEAILEGIIPNDYDAAKKYFLENKDEWLKKINDGELI